MTDAPFPAFADGFTLCAALIVSIGAQNTFVLRQGLRREHVGPVVAVCAMSDLALTAAGVAGLGALVAALPGLDSSLTLGGAAFLLWYGLGALRRALRPGRLAAGPGEAPVRLAPTLARAAGFTFLNPHVYLDTVVLMGALGAAHAGAARPAFVAGAGLASAGWFAGLGYGARLLAPVFARPGAWRALDGLIALIMAALAAGLVRRAVG